MKVKLHLVLVLWLGSLSLFAQETIVIPEKVYQIDVPKKLIVVNKSVAEINTLWPGSKSAISLNATYTFQTPQAIVNIGIPYLVENASNEVFTLYFTELPLIEITTNNTIVDDPRVSAQFTIAEPDGTIKTNLIGIEFRGGSSQAFPKKSFRIEFWADELGTTSVDFTTGGLRSDDDWNLQAMYNEPLRLRGKTNNELWRVISPLYYGALEPDAVSGVRMIYTEVFLNGDYRGVYALSERVDRKQLKLKKYNGTVRGELYKGDDWGDAVRFLDTPTADNNSEMWSGFQYDYPDEIPIDWSRLRSFVSFVVYGSDSNFFTNYQSEFEIANATEYFIFLNLMRATDNVGKNIYIAKYTSGDPYFYVPWDMDGTFGNKYDGTRVNITNDILSNGLFNRMMEDTQLNSFNVLAQQRWNELRANNTISHDAIMDMFMENHDFLFRNAVYERESMEWDYTYNPDDITYMSDWITDRLAFLDIFFANITLSVADNFIDKNAIKMYPNPAVNEFYISNPQLQTNEVAIYSLTGQKVMQKNALDNDTAINVSSLTSGIYLVSIETDTEILTKKLVIKRN
jgi:hypothetical protein